MAPDPTTEAMSLMIDIPTKVITSSTELAQVILSTLRLFLAGAANSGGALGVAEKLVDKVDEAVHGGRGGTKNESYVIKRAHRDGDNVEIINAIEKMEGIFDQNGFVDACNRCGIDIAFVRNPNTNNPAVMVRGRDRNMVLSLLESHFKSAMDDLLGKDCADRVAAQADRVVEDSQVANVAKMEDCRNGYAKLNALRRDPTKDVNVEELKKTFGLEDVESYKQVVYGGKNADVPYEFSLEKDPAGRTCWCCHPNDEITIAADPCGGHMIYRHGKPVIDYNVATLKNDAGETWSCRRGQRLGVAGGEKYEGDQIGLLAAALGGVVTYEEALEVKLREQVSYEEAFARADRRPKGLSVGESSADTVERVQQGQPKKPGISLDRERKMQRTTTQKAKQRKSDATPRPARGVDSFKKARTLR